jgi:ribose 5-phosphate isomerase B
MADISEAPEPAPEAPRSTSDAGSPTATAVTPLRLAVGADHAGFELKGALINELTKLGYEIQDLGTDSLESTDYPDYGHAVSEAVEEGRADLGILVCGTGVGMSITANRHSGIRAVVCSEPFSARMSRRHNHANVLCLGARVVGLGTALDIVDAFLHTAYEGGRHARRVAKMNLIEDAAGAAGSRPPRGETA